MPPKGGGVLNRLRKLREEYGWSQEMLGKKLKVQKATVSKYETERSALTPALILQLCDIFNCSADYLLGRSTIRSCQECPAATKQGDRIIRGAFEGTDILLESGLLPPGSERIIQDFLSNNADMLKRLIEIQKLP